MAIELTPEIRKDLAEAIDEAGGAEVFFGAAIDTAGRIVGVEVLARGDEDEVPAMLATLDLWDLVIHNHPGGDIRPSKADLNVAAHVAGAGKGFAIVDNDAARIHRRMPGCIAETGCNFRIYPRNRIGGWKDRPRGLAA